jgi:hypothetical protein
MRTDGEHDSGVGDAAKELLNERSHRVPVAESQLVERNKGGEYSGEAESDRRSDDPP